jgi:hypothetical protein
MSGRIRTPEQEFSPENSCEAVPRPRASGGECESRGRILPSALAVKKPIFGIGFLASDMPTFVFVLERSLFHIYPDARRHAVFELRIPRRIKTHVHVEFVHGALIENIGSLAHLRRLAHFINDAVIFF